MLHPPCLTDCVGAPGMWCPKCALANPESAAFCSRCGAALDSTRSFPEQDAQPSSQAERRRLTVVFCDLVGSTALSGQLDPEELHDLTRRYQRVCADVIGRHGGHVAQFLGDGLLVYFGYPIAHEDDAQRAVRAGLETVAAISGLGARLEKSLQVRVAVHTGLAVVGHLGDGTDPDAIAIVGETPNIAARLQSIAEPGTVIISSPTYRLVEGFFHCRSLGAPALKGVAAPIELYSVLAESGIQSRFERAVASGLTPFVSRQAEVELLLQRLERARNGAGQVVLLSGEAGIGKSRLIRVLKERATGEPMTELAVRCSPYYQDSALYPIIAFFQRLLQVHRDETAETTLATLESALESFGLPLSEFVPLFAALLSLPNDHRYPPPAMTLQRQKQKTFEAVVAWLLKAAQHRTTWLVVEDVHWADPSTLELLSLLIEQVSRSRVFVVLIFRPDFLPPWRSQPHVSSTTLDRLPKTGIESMIESLAGGKKLPPDVTRDIAEKTEGVPLFIEELSRMVLESGLLREQDGRYELTSSLPSLAIPSTLYESLMARLDRLGTAKEVAQLAATIGREFSYDLLRTISPLDETKLTGALNRLVDAELLDQHLLSLQRSYSFRHALIRDAAYESLLRSKRRQYHGQIAAALQESFPEIVNANPELVAVHYTDAGLVEKAILFWHRAGHKALERSANQEAIRHLTKGLELLSILPETPEHLQQELLLRATLGPAVMLAKGFASLEAQNVYNRARILCQQVTDAPLRFQVFWALWVSHAARGEHGKARESAEECLRQARASQDATLSLGAHFAVGVSLLTLGEFGQGFEHIKQGSGIYDRSQHSRQVRTYGQDNGVICLCYEAFCLWFLGHPDQALKRIREALTLARELSHPTTTVTAANIACWVYQLFRDGQATLEQAEAAISLSADREFEFWRAMGEIMRGWALTRQGMLENGIAHIRTGMSAFRSTGGEIMLPYFMYLLAEAYGRLGLDKEGLGILTEAQAAIESSGERWCEAEVQRLKGELILLQPDILNSQEAEACFRRALATARAQNAKSLELRAAISLSRLLQRQGKPASARDVLTAVYNWFTEGFNTTDLREARKLLEQLQAA
jgi:class 3 adenylate cyclase/predicted ATPase